MRQFLKYILATLVALFLFIFIGFAILAGIAAKSMKSSGSNITVEANSVLKIASDRPIAERSVSNPFAKLSGEEEQIGLDKILKSIRKAKTDDKIKGIYLDLSTVTAGLASVDEIRTALQDFKTSGKFVVGYGEVLTQKAYYLGSVANELYVNPVGYMELKGFSSEIMFYKKMLDRLEITPEIFYVGKYKSFTEPFRFTQMSEPNREQVSAFLNDFYQKFIRNISNNRNIAPDSLCSIVDNLMVRTPQDAAALKLVDGTKYYDEVENTLRNNLGLKEDEKVKFVSIANYAEQAGDDKDYGKDKIAVVYAFGDIIDGKGEEGSIASKDYVKILQKIRTDDKVKAVVLRVNSPGGSALASDVILREIDLIKDKKIPVVVSMGDVAASGGYYISCHADSIYAEENTITGSIGVFGILPILDKFLDNKIGITTDRVKTAKYSDFLNSLNRPLTDNEKLIMQQRVDKIYDDFLSQVAKGRNMHKDSVHTVAQGRVWTGTQALQLGLVDKIGRVDEAVACAARMANLGDNYRISNYPREEDPFEKIIKKINGTEDEEAVRTLLQEQLGVYYQYIEPLQKLQRMQGIQMRLPYELNIQ